MSTSIPAGASPPGSWTPDPAALAAFAEREFVCHRCRAEGTESRGTDQSRGAAHYRFGAGRLLLPFCPACGLDHPARRDAESALRRAVLGDGVPWVDPAALPVLECPVEDCPRPRWHHLGMPLPYPVVTDPHLAGPDRRWHPCPWCVAETPERARDEHRRRASSVADLRQWEDELRP